MTHLWNTPARECKERYGLTTFVETGCEDGEGLKIAKEYGFAENRLFSCDIRKEATLNVSRLFPKATIILDDSVNFIRRICSSFDTPTLFWLDAHFPSLYNSEKGTRWPLFQELEAIKNKSNMEKDVIICDDMRVLQSPQNPCFNLDEMNEVADYLVEVDWESFVTVFASTHNAQSILVDTGLMVFTPKEK